ncbi:heparinase [Grimontia sp. S25]|uniref:Heparinase n=1 Tax=Grimontia sedimenti TaxID=2711294 RepID=A0A6M1RE74_9GAMM|nr:heparinase II/III family protein [Grimontia sedimenti]NGN98464.1 heparinase [Grimontia sedimenti]
MFNKVLQYWHTIKYLKFSQIYYRIKYKFGLFNKELTAPECGVENWEWVNHFPYMQSISNDGIMNFLKESCQFNDSLDWNDPSKEKLWLYNLHYFDDLNAIKSEERQVIHDALISSWIQHNPEFHGNGWEPYPLSLRIVNWVKYLSRQPVKSDLHIESLVKQTEALNRQLEYHLLGNHLFANAKALVFAGAFINHDLGMRYMEKGLETIEAQLPEQFLPDGGHFELSPMYHCILLWDLLELIELCNISSSDTLRKYQSDWLEVAARALEWLRDLIHPDGNVSFFNDSAIGIARTPDEIFSYADLLGIEYCRNIEAQALVKEDTGFTRIKNGDFHLIFDHGNVGPDYLPGHSHADTLSFELSIGNERVFVNSGTSLYGNSEERLRQRKTPAHNTVTVLGQDSSEVWSGFRVAKRARAKVVYRSVDNEAVNISAQHDGYTRLKKGLIHERQLKVENSVLSVVDRISQPLSSVFNLHIHPDIQVSLTNDYEAVLHTKLGRKFRFTSDKKINLVPSSWHPQFGISVNNYKFEIPFFEGELETKLLLCEEN